MSSVKDVSSLKSNTRVYLSKDKVHFQKVKTIKRKSLKRNIDNLKLLNRLKRLRVI